jgi:predicted metalloprotease with PDZ domain
MTTAQRLAQYVLAALALVGIISTTIRAQRISTYNITLNFQHPLHASVKAVLTVPDGRLFTHGHAGGYEWSDYIKNLHAYQHGGSEIKLNAVAKGQWTLEAPVQGAVDVNYDVDLEFTRELREGTQRGGQFFGNSLYVVNRALFVMSNSPGEIDVHFSVPVDFKIATPWERTGPLHYRASDNSSLADNTTILGEFPSFEIHEGAFYLSMALPGTSQEGQALLEPVMRAALREYIRMFPRTPEFHILLTYFRGVEINGEDFKDSATLTSAEPIKHDNRVMWANYLAHEFFHHWNATLIAGNDDGPNVGTTEWFAEGATEYVANRTLVRAGIIEPDVYVKFAETNIGMYEFWSWAAAFQGRGQQSISLQEAGSKTALPSPKDTVAKTYNRAGVYNGGWVATYCIDMKIQHATQGKKSLDDLFRLMLTRFGLPGKRYTVADLQQAASDISGTDFSDFFSNYISAPNELPVNECLKEGGYAAQILNYAGEAFVSPDKQANKLEIAIRNGVIRAHPGVF